MTRAKFDELVEKMWKQCSEVMSKTKGVDYASETDRLANFKDQGKAYSLAPTKIWQVYAGKHWDAITRAINKNPDNPTKKGEPLSENIKDLIVYSFLLYGLLEDKEE